MGASPERTTADSVADFLRRHREQGRQVERVATPPIIECFDHMLSFINGYDNRAPERNRPPLTAAIVQDEFNRFKAEQLARRRKNDPAINDYGLADVISEGNEQLVVREGESDSRPRPQRDAEISRHKIALGWLVQAATQTTPAE